MLYRKHTIFNANLMSIYFVLLRLLFCKNLGNIIVIIIFSVNIETSAIVSKTFSKTIKKNSFTLFSIITFGKHVVKNLFTLVIITFGKHILLSCKKP